MIAQPLRILERLTLTAPLGVTFHDTVTGLRVGTGLDVAVYQKAIPSSRAQMFPNPSGVYVLQHAPGLSRDFEFGAGDDEFWSNLPQPAPYVMEVSDREGRFQPFSLEIDLPLPYRGVFPGFRRLLVQLALGKSHVAVTMAMDDEDLQTPLTPPGDQAARRCRSISTT